MWFQTIVLSILVSSFVEARVLKEIQIPPNGLTLDLILSSNEGSKQVPVAAMKIDFHKDKVVLSGEPIPARARRGDKKDTETNDGTLETRVEEDKNKFGVPSNEDKNVMTTTDAVELENRFAIRGGKCPTGYIRKGMICYPSSGEIPDEEEYQDE